jgi:hypothetical protein
VAGQGLDAEVGEGQDAVVVEIVDPDDAVLDIHVECDLMEPDGIFAEFVCDAVDGLDVQDLVDVHGQAARTDPS